MLCKLSGVSGENKLKQAGENKGGGGQGGQAERDSYEPDHPDESCQGRNTAEMEAEAKRHFTGRKGRIWSD